MKLPLLRLLVLVAAASVFAGCAATGGSKSVYYRNSSESYVSNRPDQLQRLQDQIYEAATGPNHVGSTYKP